MFPVCIHLKHDLEIYSNLREECTEVAVIPTVSARTGSTRITIGISNRCASGIDIEHMNDVALEFNIRLRISIEPKSEHIHFTTFDRTGVHIDIVIAGSNLPSTQT